MHEQISNCKDMFFEFKTSLDFVSKFYNSICLDSTFFAYTAVGTDDGTYINLLETDPTKKCETPSWLSEYIPAKMEPCEFDVGIDREKLHANINTNELTELCLDRTLSPLIQTSVNHSGCCCPRLAPVNERQGIRPDCAVLSVDHRLEIYSCNNTSKIWTQVFNVSSHLVHVLKQDEFKILKQRDGKFDFTAQTFSTLKEVTYLAATVDVVWTPSWVIDRVSSALFVTCQKSGHIVIWRVTFPILPWSFNLVEILDLGNAQPTCVQVAQIGQYRFVVFVGFSTGLLKTVLVSIDNLDIHCEEGPVLWDDVDRLSFTKIVWIPKEEIALSAKGPYLISFKLNICSSNVTVGKVRQVYRTAGETITDIAFRKDYAFIATTDGQLSKYCDGKVTPLSVKREICKDPMTWQCHSLSVSPNNVFVMEAVSPASSYNHLTERKPNKINVMTINSGSDIADIILQSSDSLLQLADALVFMKCYYSQEKRLPDNLEQVLTRQDEWLNSSLRMKKLVRYFLGIKLPYSSGKDELKLQADVKFLTRYILLEHCKTNLQRLVQLTPHQVDEMTANDLLSAGLMCKYMVTYSTDNLTNLFADVAHTLNLNAKEAITSISEKCQICDTEIPTIEDLDSCANGHSFSRCSQTLLLCQDPNYRRCCCCQRQAVSLDLRGSMWFKNMCVGHCVLCDFHLL